MIIPFGITTRGAHLPKSKFCCHLALGFVAPLSSKYFHLSPIFCPGLTIYRLADIIRCRDHSTMSADLLHGGLEPFVLSVMCGKGFTHPSLSQCEGTHLSLIALCSFPLTGPSRKCVFLPDRQTDLGILCTSPLAGESPCWLQALFLT